MVSITKQLRLGAVGDKVYILANSEEIWSHAYRVKGLQIRQKALKAVSLGRNDDSVINITEVEIVTSAAPPAKRKPTACSICGELGHNKATCPVRERHDARLGNQI